MVHSPVIIAVLILLRFVSNTCDAQLHQRINRRMKAVCQGPSQVAQRAAAILQQASAGAQEGARAVPVLNDIQTTEALRNFPLFVLNLEAPADLYDVTYEVSKTTIAFRDHYVRTIKLVTLCHFCYSQPSPDKMLRLPSVAAGRHRQLWLWWTMHLTSSYKYMVSFTTPKQSEPHHSHL